MKIKLYYEDKFHPTVLEVPDEECTVMIENDYRQRRDSNENKEQVTSRSMQEILDKDFNEPTFNRNRAETRRHIHWSDVGFNTQMLKVMPDVPTDMLADDYAELHQAIQKLRPQQRELLCRIFWEGESQAEIARQEGVLESAISERMRRIYKRLKKFMPDKKFSSEKP